VRGCGGRLLFGDAAPLDGVMARRPRDGCVMEDGCGIRVQQDVRRSAVSTIRERGGNPKTARAIALLRIFQREDPFGISRENRGFRRRVFSVRLVERQVMRKIAAHDERRSIVNKPVEQREQSIPPFAPRNALREDDGRHFKAWPIVSEEWKDCVDAMFFNEEIGFNGDDWGGGQPLEEFRRRGDFAERGLKRAPRGTERRWALSEVIRGKENDALNSLIAQGGGADRDRFRCKEVVRNNEDARP